MNGFWTVQQVFAFVITAAAVSGIAWRVIHKLFKQSTTTHAKIDAIESLLDQVQKTGMTAGAEAALERLERRILLTQAQVRLVMEVEGTGYVETNSNGDLIYCNTQFVHWTGMSLEEAKGRGWIAAIHPADRARVMNEWESAVNDERPIDLWYRYKFKSAVTPVHARTIAVKDDNNQDKVLGFIALIVPLELNHMSEL